MARGRAIIIGETLALAALLLISRPAVATAAPFTFFTTISGAQVVPPLTNSAAGFAQLVLETESNQVQFALVLFGVPASEVGGADLKQGLLGTNGTVMVPLTSTGGWTQTSGKLNLSASQAALLWTGTLYVEVRSTAGVAIARGQVLPPGAPGAQPVPLIPTVAPTAQPPAPAAAAGLSSITPPSTGDAGLRGR